MDKTMRTIEMMVAYGDNRWDTMMVDIPADTPDNQVDSVSQATALGILNKQGADVAMVSVYNYGEQGGPCEFPSDMVTISRDKARALLDTAKSFNAIEESEEDIEREDGLDKMQEESDTGRELAGLVEALFGPVLTGQTEAATAGQGTNAPGEATNGTQDRRHLIIALGMEGGLIQGASANFRVSELDVDLSILICDRDTNDPEDLRLDADGNECYLYDCTLTHDPEFANGSYDNLCNDVRPEGAVEPA